MNPTTWLVLASLAAVATVAWILLLISHCWKHWSDETHGDSPGSFSAMTVLGLFRMFGKGAPLTALFVLAVLVLVLGLDSLAALGIGMVCAFVLHTIQILIVKGSWVSAWFGEIAIILWLQIL